MALVPVKDLGKGGVVKDTAPALLPENVMTDALNVRFRNGSIDKILGESSLFTVAGCSPEYGIHWRRPDESYNVLIKDGLAVAKDSAGAETSMLSSVDSIFTDSKWQMDVFGGGYAVFINNGRTTPKYALYADPTADLSFQDFPGWNYTVGTTITAKVIRPFGYALVAGNLAFNDGVDIVEAPVTLRISTQAAIGGFPSVWQPGLTTDTADEFEINAKSAIVDMLELRGNMMIYTNDSIHMLSINNGIASVRPNTSGYGALSQGCVAEFDNQHFVVDRNDIYIHNGSGKIDSAAEGVVKEFFFDDLNATHAEKTFVVKNSKFKEMWVCYPSLTSVAGECNKAMIYNYVDKTWTFRTLPSIVNIFQSPLISGGEFRYAKGDTLLGCSGTIRVFLMDNTYLMMNASTGLAAAYSSYVIREKLYSGDPFGENLINGIAPVLAVVNADDLVNITVTSQNVYDQDADFTNTSGRDLFTITPQSTTQGYKVDPRAAGRFLNYKIESEDYWKLSYLALDLKPASRR